VERARAIRLPTSGQFSCKRSKIPGGCQQTAEATVSRLRSPAHWTAGKDNCFFSALRDSQFRFRTEGVRGEEALYR